MRARFSIVALLAVLFDLTGSMTSAAVTGRIAGPEGTPCAGTVRVLENPDDPDATPGVVRADDEGRFDLSGFAVGPAWVRVECPGLLPVLLKNLPGSDSLDVRLEAGSSLRGRVIDHWSGHAIPDASIWVCDGEATRFGFGACAEHRAAADGSFTVTGIPDAAVRLGGSSPAHAFTTVEVPARSHAGDFYLLELGAGAPLRGRVVDDRDRPVAGARIGQDDYTVPFSNRTEVVLDPPLITDENGEFVHPGIEERSRQVYRGLFPGWYGVPSGWVSPIKGTTQQLELRMERPAALQFGLLHEDERIQPPVRLVHKTIGTVSWIKARASGDDGRYRLEGLPTTPLELRLTIEGFQPIPLGEVELGPEKTLDLGDLEVTSGLTLSGMVSDTDGRPIEGAWVEIGYREPVKFNYRDDASKRDFLLEGLPSDSEISLRAGGPGFDPYEETLTLDRATTREILLDPVASIQGRVLRPDGEPATGFSVRAVPDTPTERSFPSLDVNGADGRFFLWPVGPPGAFRLEIAADGFKLHSIPDLRVGDRETVDLGDLRLEPGHTVEGLASRPDGTPAAGSRVWIAPRSDTGGRNPAWRYAARAESFVSRTDSDGRYSIAGLESGFFVVHALHSEFAPWSADLQLVEDVTTESVNVTFSEGGTVHGWARDAAGSPVEDVSVSAECSGRSVEHTAQTDAQGYYRIQHLPDGQCRVKAFRDMGQPYGNSKLISVVADRESRVDFDLSRSIEVTGTVRVGGQPSERAFVTFRSGRGFNDSGTSVGADPGTGRYRVALSEPGEYRVLVEAAQARHVFRTTVGNVRSLERDFDIPINWILGRVVDNDGHPLSGVGVIASNTDLDLVTTMGLYATTNQGGRFELKHLDTGRYTLSATLEGYRPARSNPIHVGAETRIENIELVLEESTAQLRGRVIDPGGTPVPEGFVFAAPVGSHRVELASHAVVRDGKFVLDVPGEGPLDVTALATGWAPTRLSGVYPSTDQELTVQVGFGGRIRVSVVDRNGAPAEGVMLDIQAEPAWLASSTLFTFNPPAVTGPDGVAVAQRIPQGAYRVTVPGGASGMVQVVEGATVELQLQAN